ncbi:MAG: hypothetical protein ACTHKJ_04220, partial [Candidatus Nitrosocosmicus sp.]
PAYAKQGNSNSILNNLINATIPTKNISLANLGPFDPKLQYYPPNPSQTADFRPIIINPEPDRNQTCKPYLDRFVMNFPLKGYDNASRFLVQAQCVTIIGNVTWTHLNPDGDSNFNVVPDPPYRKFMRSGNYAPYFIDKYSIPAIHVEVVCQGPVKENTKVKKHACDGYNGPDFKGVLPEEGDRVQVTGRWLLDNQDGIKEGGGIAGHSELHPVYDIKILDKVNGSTFNESNPSSGNNNLLSNSSLAIKNRYGGEQENSD